jgi:hypothetical protein
MGSAGVLLAEEVVLHSMGVGHVLTFSRFEYKGVLIGAEGLELMELISGKWILAI